MRTEKALKNSFVEILSNILLILFAFAIKRIFNDILGAEYLGISGLFSSLISGLCIVELGFGNAIIYNMYRPVAENDTEKIKVLIGFYQKVYQIIALIVFVLGLLLLPFVESIVGVTSEELNLNIKLIFLLYVIDVVVSYLASYKRSMLYAHQQTYITTFVHTVVMMLTYILQILVLLIVKSFYAYLIISISLRIIENVSINIIVNKKYPYILQKSNEKLDSETVKDIKKKVKGLIFHNLSTFLVLGTDNIIISMVPGLGVLMVGVYSAYSLIMSKITAIVDSVFNSLTATVGNLLLEKDKEKIYGTFKNIFLINSWIYIFAAISFYYISFPFIELWMGKGFVLDKITVFVITFKLFISGLRASFGCFKNAAGIFYEDRFVPIIESFVNLVASIPLAMCYGLKGVIIGTIISTMVLYVYTFPKYVYGVVLGKNNKLYIRDIAAKVIQFVVIFVITGVVVNIAKDSNTFITMIYRGAVCVIIPNLCLLLLNYRTKEFEFIKYLSMKIIRR